MLDETDHYLRLYPRGSSRLSPPNVTTQKVFNHCQISSREKVWKLSLRATVLIHASYIDFGQLFALQFFGAYSSQERDSISKYHFYFQKTHDYIAEPLLSQIYFKLLLCGKFMVGSRDSCFSKTKQNRYRYRYIYNIYMIPLLCLLIK